MPSIAAKRRCRVVVIWIDWYPYHVARFRGLDGNAALHGEVVGIELVGGVGVHQGLKFREDLPAELPVDTLLPHASWRDASQWELARLLWHKLNQLQPEVVLVPGYYTAPAVAAALWAKLHRRTSVLMTESTAGDHQRTAWKEWPKKIALRTLFDWAVCGGVAHVAYLRQLGFPPNRIVGGYDVVDNALFQEGAAALRKPPQASPAAAPFFLFVGRLAEEKNAAGLLRSWTSYREAGGSWPLVLCGDGPERAALETQAASSGFAADVHFPGLKAARELLPFYAHAGCFVLPSTREPWGLVVNEAMAAQLPVLVSDRCGCAVDLVRDGENGFRFDPANEANLTALLLRIAKEAPAARARMGQRSGEIIDRFSPAVFGESIATITAASKPVTMARHVTEATP